MSNFLHPSSFLNGRTANIGNEIVEFLQIFNSVAGGTWIVSVTSGIYTGSVKGGVNFSMGEV